MNYASKAVFLSYASQDADAAARIAEALRAAGVEVWFDKNELVGGDAWDQKIRRQIKQCALFVPIISANTQARLEGYFRLEWELAAVEPGRDPYTPDPIEMPLYRGLALARTGNEALAHSFFRSVLNQFTTGPQAEMMLQRAPAIVHSVSAFMHAGLGQVTEMRAAIAQARAATDPARNFQSFLQVEYLIALAFTEAGATADACATINQLLSAPAGESTGSILGNVSFDSLHGSAEFRAVIRQHADQLKDPAIIDRIFAQSIE